MPVVLPDMLWDYWYRPTEHPRGFFQWLISCEDEKEWTVPLRMYSILSEDNIEFWKQVPTRELRSSFSLFSHEAGLGALAGNKTLSVAVTSHTATPDLEGATRAAS